MGSLEPMRLGVCIPRQQVQQFRTPAILDLEAGMCCKIFHEMVKSCPFHGTRRCTETCQLRYRKRNVKLWSDPCCHKLKLCHKRTVMLVFDRIGKLGDVFGLECHTQGYRYLLWSQRFLDMIARLFYSELFDIITYMNLDTFFLLLYYHDQECFHLASTGDFEVLLV